MSEIAWSDVSERRGVRVAAPLRFALAISLALHAGFFYYSVVLRGDAELEARKTRSFEVTLSRVDAARAPAAPVELAEPEVDPEVVPEALEVPDPEALVPERRPVIAPPRAARPSRSRRRLDLSLPPEVIAPAQPRGPNTGVFDPGLRERIDAARVAPRGPLPGDAVATRARGADEVTRIETERGCYERVTDPFDDQPGDQWWLVACSRGEEIDWGVRFRRRP